MVLLNSLGRMYFSSLPRSVILKIDKCFGLYLNGDNWRHNYEISIYSGISFIVVILVFYMVFKKLHNVLFGHVLISQCIPWDSFNMKYHLFPQIS